MAVRSNPVRSLALLTVLALPFLAGSTSTLANGEATRLLRTPTVSATHIAFAYANNIWVVERAGGTARRLTSFQGQTTNPKFSPDGRSIAFSGEYGGNTDVYVVAGGRRRAEAAHVASRRRHGAGLDARRPQRAVRVGPRHLGAQCRADASGPCPPRAASKSRCRCRAPSRGRSRPTAAASPTA